MPSGDVENRLVQVEPIELYREGFLDCRWILLLAVRHEVLVVRIKVIDLRRLCRRGVVKLEAAVNRPGFDAHLPSLGRWHLCQASTTTDPGEGDPANNPATAPRLTPSIKRVIKRTGRMPRTVTADRGYGEQAVDEALHQAGVRHVVIPRRGRPNKARQAEEHRRAFRRHVKWRTGCEGRISTLKRGYGWETAAGLIPSKGPRSGSDLESWPTT